MLDALGGRARRARRAGRGGRFAAVDEFELIERLAPFLAGAADDVPVGHGDDAAVVEVGGRWVCVTVDVLVDGVHFRRDVSSMADVGWKAVAVSVSDIAAMGARPTAAVVGLARPGSLPGAEVEELYEGMHAACRHWGLRLVGGDTVSADALALSVTALGEVAPHRAVTRAGARPGDRLVLVGGLGAAAAALALLERGLDVTEPLLTAHRRPRPLPTAGRILAEHGASALIDVSDGLGLDLGHICAASTVRASVEATALPLADGVQEAAAQLGADVWDLACGGGEDFALLAAVPAGRAAAAAAAAGAGEGVPAAVVGTVVAPDEASWPAVDGTAPTAVLSLPDGSVRALDALGYDHYRRHEEPI